MGIRGLTTYINNRSGLLEPYELHGGYVVIDGENLAIELYRSSARSDGRKVHCNCVFGGDYNIYVQWVANFFDKLEKCDVTPLVLMDGGMEDKKIKTLYERREWILRNSLGYTPDRQARRILLPANAMLASTTYLLQRGTKLVRCVFENDPCIAGVAKILNCPVLSLDSDFYIFGVKYICSETLKPFVARSMNGDGYVMHCKMFKVENLLRLFPGLDCSVLPLVAVLLGNDYVKGETFKNFFNCLELSNENQSQCNIMHTKIDAILAWLSERKLNDAVAAILSTLPVECRQEVLDIIELIVNGYLLLPYDMLEPLCLAHKYQGEILARSLQEKFSFEGHIGTLKLRQFWREDEVNLNSNWGDDDTKLPFGMRSDVKNCSSTFVDTLPHWFKHEYNNAAFLSSFVNMMFRRLFVGVIQVEDPAQPSAVAMSLNIIRVIDGLLVAGREEPARDLTYVIRDGTRLVSRKVPTVYGINSIDFPALSKLRDTPLSLRKKIFDDTLEISGKENLIEDIPSIWRLYIATTLYWIDQTDEPSRNSCHIYAMLLTMLLGVVDQKIGYYQPLHNLNKKYKIPATEIKAVRKKKTSAMTNARSDSIIEALAAVTESDCLEAANFFISNYQEDEMLLRNPQEFDVTIVHVFSQFQSCLRSAISLNVLLGCPYEYPIIGELYNGTMLYNLYIQFEKYLDVEAFIAKSLEKAPSFLRLLNLLIAKMKMLVDRPVANGYREKRFERERSGRQIEKNKKTGKENGRKTKKNEGKLKENILDEDNEDDESSDYSIEDILTEDEVRQICTPKVKKLLDTDHMGANRGRGLTKRKNKKKRKKQLLDEYSVTEDTVFHGELMAGRRFPKPYPRFRQFDITRSLD